MGRKISGKLQTKGSKSLSKPKFILDFRSAKAGSGDLKITKSRHAKSSNFPKWYEDVKSLAKESSLRTKNAYEVRQFSNVIILIVREQEPLNKFGGRIVTSQDFETKAQFLRFRNKNTLVI